MDVSHRIRGWRGRLVGRERRRRQFKGSLSDLKMRPLKIDARRRQGHSRVPVVVSSESRWETAGQLIKASQVAANGPNQPGVPAQGNGGYKIVAGSHAKGIMVIAPGFMRSYMRQKCGRLVEDLRSQGRGCRSLISRGVMQQKRRPHSITVRAKV